MAEAVIVAAARTPIGRANKGSLVDVDAFALAVAAIDEVAKRSGLDRKLIDDIVLAESLQGGGVIARHAAVTLGMHQVPGLALNRWCAAGMAAVQTAAATVVSGMGSAIIAGGTESMSSMPQQLKSLRFSTALAPIDRTNSALDSSDTTPMALAPETAQSWVANTPRPPDAPQTSTLSPGRRTCGSCPNSMR